MRSHQQITTTREQKGPAYMEFTKEALPSSLARQNSVIQPHHWQGSGPRVADMPGNLAMNFCSSLSAHTQEDTYMMSAA